MTMYKTSDFYLSTVLSMSFALRDITYMGKRATFHFDDTQELRSQVDAFWNGLLQVEPQALFNAQKTLKSRLYSNEMGEE